MCLFGELCGMSWWISVQLLADRFSHCSKSPSHPAPLQDSCQGLFIYSSYDPTCLSIFCRDGEFLMLHCVPSGLGHCQPCTGRVELAVFLILPGVAAPLHLTPRDPHVLDTFSHPHDWFCLACGIIFSSC